MNHFALTATGLLVSAAFLAGPAPALADSGSTGADVSVATTLGSRELTVTLRRVTSVPGPLGVDVITHAGSGPGTLQLAVTPVGATTGGPPSGLVTSTAALALSGTPGPAGAVLTVDRTGPWELSVDDGLNVARIPFVVPGQASTPAEKSVYGGFVAAGVCLLAGIVVAVAARRTWLPALPGAALVAAVAVAVTGAVLSASTPAPPMPGQELDPTVANAADPYAEIWRAGGLSRPPATLLLGTTAVPRAAATPIGLSLCDAATGLPVDDLVVHDGALIHLMIVGPGGELWHLHPARTAPGTFTFTFTAPRNGHYAVAGEVERRGGGVQMLRSASGFDVTGPGTAAPAAAPLPATGGSRTIDGTAVQVAMLPAVAGTPVTLRAQVGDRADLQPWLGMLGHLIVVGPLGAGGAQTAPLWAHAHAMGAAAGMAMGASDAMVPVASAIGATLPDETVAAYGPTVGFTFAFPLPGRYQVWVQAERNYTIITVPIMVTVGT
ncbi:hypothetical protein BJ973_000160 [Actinoplanes tereljensis]|uniref:Secreted protein n=1 Tax=Paractinoplanes tereljensis TaxID=571912 RepID=A0A919TZ19_9ACTN|nr:hypothetical protein [Actinoplanes tereljensis]GIF26749.1 hypothetical protein Ate02nite_94790 [Actinoplanes tereljensis]